MAPFINLKNQRKTQRIDADSMMKYILKETEHYFSGDICNLSHCGLCFETGYFIQPGSIIKIKIDQSLENLPLSDRIHGCHAKVKWCESPPGVSAFSYRVGVEFLEK